MLRVDQAFTRRKWETSGVTYLFPTLRWMMRNTTPRRMQTLPTTRYAMPRKGFLPPSQEVVVRMNRFVPSNIVTG